MPIHNNIQREKAADVLAQLLASYGNTEPDKVTRFRNAVVKELNSPAAAGLRMIGCMREPDRLITKALNKANCETGDISHVIMVSFEEGESIRFFLDGGWHER